MSKASAVSAIERGDLSELQHVLEESEWDIGSEPLDSKGQTALHIACTNGQLDIVQYLVENDENDSAKRTATGLLLSLTNKKCNVAEYLLSKTSEYFPYYAKEVIHSNKLIPQLENEILLVSCAMGYFEVVKFLFKVVSGNVLDDYIQSAYANEHWDILMYLKVKKGDSDFSDVSPPHLTPLQLEVAWRNEQFEAVIALLELTQKRDAHLTLGLSPTGISQLVETVHSAKGAYDATRGLKIKTKVIEFEEYVMNIAYSKEYTEVFKFLCTTNQTGVLKTIPLCRKSLRIVQYLIKHKIMSDIHVACIMGDVKKVKVALESNGPSTLCIADPSGNLAIHYAVYEPGVLSTILNAIGNDLQILNAKNASGETPLHHCIIACCAESLDLLIKFPSCDVNLSNYKGETPLHIACKKINISAIQLLVADERCDLNIPNSSGDTPLHIAACSKSESAQMMQCLLQSGRCDCNLTNRQQCTPLHVACKEMNIRGVEILVADERCDLNIPDRSGDTPLHIAACSKSESAQMMQCLLQSGRCDCNLINRQQCTPLHVACEEMNIRRVEILVADKGCDLNIPDSNGEAPIHIACRKSNMEVIELLLGYRNCNPNQQNASGDTALHIVCKSRFSLQLVKTLISTPGIDPGIVNHKGLTPIEEAGINYAAIDAIKKFLVHKNSSIQGYIKIFVVGNSGTGKSTLIKAVTTEASQLLKYSPLSKMKYVNPSDVPPHTAGIVPIPFNSKHFGNAVLYDFAGQHEYYSSHAAVMENLILPSPPLFLLLVDISKSTDDIREELVYWWHFINNQSQKAAAPPHVILASSHEDMVKSRDREKVETMIRDCIKRIPVTFEFVDYFSLDCRKLVSRGLSRLLTQLHSTCQTLRDNVDVNLHCHILRAFLTTPEFRSSVYCKAVDIMNRIESDDAPLPKTFSHLIPLLASLNDQGHILLLQNHNNESESWVILKPNVLLTEVSGSVFAPEYFKEHHSQFAMSTGVVTSTKLKEKFAKYDHEVIVEYLTHLEFCFRIKDLHTLNMITNNQVLLTADQTTEHQDNYYFFPALVRVENPTDVGQPHQSINYECGWLYKCSKEIEQLTTRFLHVLILRLAFSCEPPDDPTETESVVLLRSCSVWKHGIAWWTNDGIEVIVEVGLQCRWVAVMMRCPDNKKVHCAVLRSKVIKAVLKAKSDFCPAITMNEYLIGPSSLKYPFEGRELTLYSIREVARVTIEGKEYAKDSEGKNLIKTQHLLPFEPYHNVGELFWKFFSGDTSDAVTPEELIRLTEKCHDKLAEFKTAFKPDISSFQRDCEKADCQR